MDSDNDSDVGDILSDLLANGDVEETEKLPPKETLKELDFNFLDNIPQACNENKLATEQEKSEVYDNALDSSDDEDRRNFQEQKYSDYGREIKNLLKKDASKESINIPSSPPPMREKSSRTFDFSAKTDNKNSITSTTNTITNISKDIYSDPFFGLRIINPVVSSVELKSRMNAKIPVTISKIKFHLNSERMEKDWVIAGVLINKSLPKTSQKGSSYSIWKLSDLSENMSTVSIFMFSTAYKTFWKTTVGTVIGILNPNVLEPRDNTDQVALSIDNPQKFMILGKSKDIGKCKSIKKNGEPCNSIVNISRCEFCLFHIKQEYKKCSSRADLQTFSNTQKFSVDMLKQKAQRKPIFNNMPEFNAIVAVKNKKMEEKDHKRLALLSGSQKTENSYSKNVNNVNDIIMEKDRVKRQFEEINRSRGWKAAVLSQTSANDNVAPASPALLKSNSCKGNTVKKNLNSLCSSLPNPRLGVGCLSGTIDLLEPITKKHVNFAKSNAIKWVEEHGKIKAKNPNKVRLSKEEKIEMGKKRHRESENDEEQQAKRPNVLTDKFKEIMQAKSTHTDLIEQSYEQEKEKYFNKLEMKERMEGKMLTTYKVPCKAVRCLICKYTSFSASDLCKEQKHPLHVSDALKRFFKCGDCGNRTVSLNRIPSHSCIKCGSSSWTRAAMMDERKTNVSGIPLSIRGDEETHIGSLTKHANLNLLVPDKDDK